MTFQDIFKSSFLENVSSVSLLDMGLALVLAFGLGLFIFLIYKKTFAGVMYSSSFGVTLVALTMITTLVILAVTSNVVLSLGMVGALSIVRFRAAIKEPLDIAFLFWAIAVGIPGGVEALEDFCLLRAQSVQGQLEGAIPSTDEGQSEDSSTLVDASSVDISAMGTMNNGGGQRSWERGMGQSQEALEGAGMSVATQDSAGQAPAIPQGQEGMGSPPELPSGEGPQEAPGQAAPDSASSATEESPSSEVESSSGEGDTSSGEESASAPAEAGGAMGQELPTQPAEGAADAGIEAQPGALGQGQSQASSTTEQWMLLGGSFLALGMGLAAAGFYHRKG